MTANHPAGLLVSRLVYGSVWAVTLLYALLCEADILPMGYVNADPQTTYLLQVLCVLYTLAATWGALRLFAMKRIKARLAKPAAVGTWNLIRTAILALAVFLNQLTYYALLDSSFLYCWLITLVGLLFCVPKKEE